MVDLMKEEIVKTSSLTPDNTNPNVIKKVVYEALKKNIKKYGFLIPVIVNKKGLIADGFHRWKIARELGMEEIKIVRLDVNDVDRRILRQVMNKLRGSHDLKKDTDDYRIIFGGIKRFDLLELLPNDATVIDRVFEEMNSKESVSEKIGQVDQLGKHLITCPKCKHRFMKKDMGDKS